MSESIDLIMIKIAIYDNDRAELEKMSRSVSAFFETEKTDFTLKTFKDTAELSASMQITNSFDLLILDAKRKTSKGMELAAELRDRGETCEIIFTSNTTELAYEAYKLNAIQYILKPYQKSELYSAISRALTQIGNASPGYTVFKTSDGLRRVAWNEIVNSYTVGHYQLISLTDGSELKVRATSDELYSMLEESGYFMRVGSPYIINIKYLRELGPREITLEGGARIPLPKNSYKAIKNTFLEMEQQLKGNAI